MTQILVPAVATPMLLEDAEHAFVEAWPIAVAAPLAAPPVSVAIAHCALECGNFGYKNGKPADPPTLYCWDLGNTRPAQGEDCEVCQYPGDEIIDGRVVKFAPPDPRSTFRAFRTPAEGVAAQLKFLAGRTRYAQAWLRLLAGDPAGFVDQLHAHGYFTADPGPYRRAVVSIYARVLPSVQNIIAGQAHGITDADRDHVEQMVALSLSQVSDPEPFPLT